MTTHNFIVGTFNTPSLYTLSFAPPASPASNEGSLKILKRHDAVGSHSWLALSKDKKNLYATAWLEPPSIAAYSIDSPSKIRLLNTAATKSRSGYVCCSNSHVYSTGGATGEVFALDEATGALVSPSQPTPTETVNGTTSSTINGSSKPAIRPVQLLDFVADRPQRDDGSTMDFGGLRHGAHSADLSPDGTYMYVADIGRNCVWTYSILSKSNGFQSKDHLQLVEKFISPRSHDGPRHAWPHPNGRILYVLQEHSSVVDVFSINAKTGRLTHVQGVRIIPKGLPVGDFWADEVRTSLSDGDSPKYLYASTRGLKQGRKGFVAIFRLDKSGRVDGAELVDNSPNRSKHEADDQDQGGLLCMYETATSGGWANAIQPGPTVNGIEYSALTDSEAGLVFVLGWDGQQLREASRVDLNIDSGVKASEQAKLPIVGAATAVWL